MIIKENKTFLNFLSLLFILIPLSLITGPFFPDLFIVIINLSLIGYIIFKKKFYIFNNLYFKFFIIICFYLSLISVVNLDFNSMKSSIFYFRFGLFALFSYYLINNNDNILKYIYLIFVFIYIALFIDTLYQYFFSKNILGFVYHNAQNFRLTSFFGKDEVLGSYTARFFPLLLFLIFFNLKNKDIKKSNYSIILFTVISFVVVLLSGERTSIGLFILSFLFIFFSSIKLRRIFIIPLISIIIIFFFTISASEKIKNRVVTTTINQMGLNSDSERFVVFSKTYEGHYLISYNMFKEKPFFGHGAKMFRVYCQKEENYVGDNACTTHPHNFYAQMLAETGIIGFIILFGIFVYVCYLFLKNFYNQLFRNKQIFTDESICLLSYYFMTLFPLLPSGNFFNNWLSIIIYYPLGFLIYLINKKRFYA